MEAFKLFVQHLFSLANLGWAEGRFANPCKNKQCIKDFCLTDLRRFACPWVCK